MEIEHPRSTIGREPLHANLLKAFALRSRVSDRPLMAVSPDYVMGNWAAQPYLGTVDFQRARALADSGDGPWHAVQVLDSLEPGFLCELPASDELDEDRADAASEPDTLDPVLPGHSRIIQKIRREAIRIEAGSGHVLISGEEGTGKAMLAARILSRRPSGLVTVDGATSASWIEQTMAALRDRHDVLLRHVSSIDPHAVADLRQMLDGASRRGLRVVMTATPNLPMRLNALASHVGDRLWLPPLRDRLEDIPDIIAAWRVERRFQRPRLDADTLRWLWSHAWPGNVRELVTVMRARSHGRHPVLATAREAGSAKAEGSKVQDLQRRALVDVLERCEGNRSRAALLLGISRATLYRKMNQFDLRP